MTASIYSARESLPAAACVAVSTAIGQGLSIDSPAFLLILSLSWTAYTTCRFGLLAQQEKRKEWQEARRKWVLENTTRPVAMCGISKSQVAVSPSA